MKVLIDGVVFETEAQLGIRRVFNEVLSRLSSSIDILLWLERPALVPLPAGTRVVVPRCGFGLRWLPTWNVPARALRKAGRRWAPCWSERPEVFHSTFFTRPGRRGPPEVVTVYDMIPETEGMLHPKFADWCRRHVEGKRDCLDNARLIIAISHDAAESCARIYPHLKERLRVIYCGADHLLTSGPAEERPRPLDDPYVLFVGDRLHYKNSGAVWEALRSSDWPRKVLLAVCGPPFSAAEQQELARRGLTERVRHFGRVADEELAHLYRNAAAFVFPSKAEGFGLPLLEAQSQKCPVVCSDISIFREIAGAAAAYFNPGDPHELAARVQDVLRPAERERLCEAGRENIKRFRWEQCAKETLQVYREAACSK